MKGNPMIEVSEKAQEKIDSYVEENSVKAPIRIQVTEGCCGSSYLGMAVDEFKETDNRYVASGVTYVIDKDLVEQTGRLTIDFIEKDGMAWFQIDSENPFAGAQTDSNSCCS